jgi:bifunctional DNA-binding transcriptional regulator/antitoxin component of YhaV-PrlF toxin-antitoxin module
MAMSRLTLPIDREGRISLPAEILDQLGIRPESEVIMEVGPEGALIRPKSAETPLTDLIAEMNLPVSDWDQMKAEIIAAKIK